MLNSYGMYVFIRLKPKKPNQKKQKEPRFAFMTKSQVDHLEDGYRWRKYGQKAVKNSPFPRYFTIYIIFIYPFGATKASIHTLNHGFVD